MAEIAPKKPVLISSSIQGIIRTIEVEPNQKVAKGQVLFVLDKISLENKFQEAEKSLAISEEQYRKAYQAAYDDPKSKDALTVLKEEVEKAKNELDYASFVATPINH